jgi:dolichol-phosphate mannosyltransferase
VDALTTEYPKEPFNEVMNNVFAVLPTYNEAENLPHLMAELFSLEIPHLKIIIVDDASPDGSGEMAETLRELFHPDVHVIHRSRKMGIGTAYLEGFQAALEHGAEYIIQMDTDLSPPFASLLDLLEQANQFDVVVGSRFAQNQQSDLLWDKGITRLGQWVNNATVRLILGLHVKDVFSGLKCWTRRALLQVLDHPTNSNGFIFQAEMAYLAELTGLRVKETPIDFQKWKNEESKFSTLVRLEAVLWTVQLRLRYHNRHQPG